MFGRKLGCHCMHFRKFKQIFERVSYPCLRHSSPRMYQVRCTICSACRRLLCSYVVNGQFTADRCGNWLRSWRMKTTRRRSVNIGGGHSAGLRGLGPPPPCRSPRPVLRPLTADRITRVFTPRRSRRDTSSSVVRCSVASPHCSPPTTVTTLSAV